MTIVASFLRLTPSPLEDILRSDLSTTDVFLFCWPLRLVRARPSMSSIICSRKAWSLVSMGTTEISRTARNWPQLLRCSFSRRKKFQIKRLKSYKKGNACDSSDRRVVIFVKCPAQKHNTLPETGQDSNSD